MTKEEKAYLAGLVDGEGTVTLARQSKSQQPQPRLAISNNSLELLEWVRRKPGCGVIIRRTPRKDWHNTSYVWQAQRAGSVLNVLTEIKPYLILKKAHAALLLSSYKACTPRNGKYTPDALDAKLRLVDDIRRLNQAHRSPTSIIRQAPAEKSAG